MPAKGFRMSPFGGSGAATGDLSDEQFVVLALSADLSQERVLTGTANQILITDNGANSTVVISIPANSQLSIAKITNLTTNGYVKTSTGDGTLSVATSVPTSDISGGAALTKTDDTNVTLTLGGSPTTALLAATSLTLGWTGTLGVARGGTNISSYAVGDLIYASTTSVLSKLADVATGNALISGGVGVAPSYGKIGLTTHITGTLGVGNGGTGTATTFTTGSVIFAGASGVYTQDNANFFWDDTNNRLGIGTTAPTTAIDTFGVITSTRNALGGSGPGVISYSSVPDSFVLTNTTAATSIATVQRPAAIRFHGNAWKSNATAASQTQDWLIDMDPASGATTTNSSLNFWSSINGATYKSFMGMQNIDTGNGQFMSIAYPMSMIIQSATGYAAFNLLTTQSDSQLLNLQAAGGNSYQFIHQGGSVSTSDATFTTASTIPINEGDLFIVQADIAGRDGTTTDNCVYRILGTFKREGGGSAVQLGTTTIVHAYEDSAATDVQFAVSGNNVLVQVKGQAFQIYNWAVYTTRTIANAGGVA